MARQPAKTKSTIGDLVEELADIDTIMDNPRNPRGHPDDQITRLMASLQARGQYKPLLVRRENRMMIAGHGLRMAARQLGWTKIRAAFWDVDQATADRAMLGDNILSDRSTSDEGRVAELLREIPESEWMGVGFSDDEATKLMNSLGGDELVVREIETSEKAFTFWINVTGPLPDQATVLQKLKQLLAEHPSVVIELGTSEAL